MFAFNAVSADAVERRQRDEAAARRRRQVRGLPADRSQPFASPSVRVRERLGRAIVAAGVRVAGQRSPLSQLRPP